MKMNDVLLLFAATISSQYAIYRYITRNKCKDENSKGEINWDKVQKKAGQLPPVSMFYENAFLRLTLISSYE